MPESDALNFQFILLGAVPFPIDVPRLKDLGVRGVITLNESYETLVPTKLYYVSILCIPCFGCYCVFRIALDYCLPPAFWLNTFEILIVI